MKLVSFSTPAIPKPHLGLVQGDEVIDIDLAGRALKLLPADSMLDFIAHYEQGKQNVQTILNRATGRRLSQVRAFTDVGAVHKLSEVQLAAPIPHPSDRSDNRCPPADTSDGAPPSTSPFTIHGEPRNRNHDAAPHTTGFWVRL